MFPGPPQPCYSIYRLTDWKVYIHEKLFEGKSRWYSEHCNTAGYAQWVERKFERRNRDGITIGDKLVTKILCYPELHGKPVFCEKLLLVRFVGKSALNISCTSSYMPHLPYAAVVDIATFVLTYSEILRSASAWVIMPSRTRELNT